MDTAKKIASVTTRYLLRFLQLWLFWFWFVALDAVGLIVDTFVPGFSPPRWVYWAIPGIGFVVANVKLFSDQESHITQLAASKADALNAVTQEIEMNRASAAYNAQVRGKANSPGSLPFERMDDSQSRGILLSGRFALDDSLLEVAREYSQVIRRVNTLIANVEVATTRFRNASGTADTIRQCCSGQTETPAVDQTAGLPTVMDKLQKLIEQEMSST